MAVLHDAEILSIRLDREGPHGPIVEMRIHLFQGSRVGDRFAWRNHTIATIRFSTAQQVSIEGFNTQNCIFDLKLGLEKGADQEMPWSGPAYRVTMDSSFGAACSWVCSSIEVVKVESGIPPGSVYS